MYLGALAKLFSGSLGEHLQGSAFLVEDYFAKKKKKTRNLYHVMPSASVNQVAWE